MGLDLAIICGATGALGTAVVDAFATRGDRVIAVARSRAELSKLEALYPSPSGGGQGGGVVTGVTADLTQRREVDEVWERIDRIGVPRWLVNATGGFRAGKVADTTPDDFALMMDLNLGSAWWSCRAAARRMTSGSMVNVSSRSALVSEPGAAAYAIAKTGVIKLTEVLAAELKAAGIRVNCVVPAIIDTPSNRQSMPEKLLHKAVPASQVASVIAYLCSDAAGPITGASVPVYGRF